MKAPVWDDCKNSGSEHDYKPGDTLKRYRDLAVGMIVTAFHTEDRVEIRIDQVLEENSRYAGAIVRVHTDNETSGDLAVDDEVAISIGKICYIDQNIK